jgi:hypothetical protein
MCPGLPSNTFFVDYAEDGTVSSSKVIVTHYQATSPVISEMIRESQITHDTDILIVILYHTSTNSSTQSQAPEDGYINV